MTDEELIKQLRDITFFIGSLEELGADRIEQLVKEQERLEEQCEGLARVAMNNGLALLTAEAKLAKAVEALQKLVKLDDDYSPFSGELLQDRVVRTWEDARAVLAELEKPE